MQLPLLPQLGHFLEVALYFHAAVFLDSALLIRPALRPAWYRLLVSWPAQYAAASRHDTCTTGWATGHLGRWITKRIVARTAE